MVIDRQLVGTLMIMLMVAATIASMYSILFSNWDGPDIVIQGSANDRAAKAFISYLVMIILVLVVAICIAGR